MRNEKEILTTFNDWAIQNDNVRCAIMTSSRTNDKCELDFLSDYDIEIYVRDIKDFSEDNWLDYFGEVMVKWPFKAKATLEENWLTRLILFKDGVRIDFQITDLKQVDISRYENGYKVLIDKDNIASIIPKPTYSEFIIKKPTKDEYEAVVNEYWWNVYYVPKYLWRDQLPFSKYMLDYILRYEYLHKLVDWYIGSKHNWEIETGALGKYYKKLLNSEDWNEFEASYAGGGIDDNWQALLKSTEFFRKLGIELGQTLGYDYPHEVDNNVMAFCRDIMNTKKS